MRKVLTRRPLPETEPAKAARQKPLDEDVEALRVATPRAPGGGDQLQCVFSSRFIACEAVRPHMHPRIRVALVGSGTEVSAR